MRIFQNPNDLSESIVNGRLLLLDSTASARIYKSLGFSHFGIDSTLTDAQIITVLSTTATTAEAQASFQLRRSAALAKLVSSGLAGRNITSVNNTADRDALNVVICYMLGLTDANGLILGNPVTTAQGK